MQKEGGGAEGTSGGKREKERGGWREKGKRSRDKEYEEIRG